MNSKGLKKLSGTQRVDINSNADLIVRAIRELKLEDIDVLEVLSKVQSEYLSRVKEKEVWHHPSKLLPKTSTQFKNTSVNVFVKVKGISETQVMAYDYEERLWADCSGAIHGDPMIDDEYEVLAWKYINC